MELRERKLTMRYHLPGLRIGATSSMDAFDCKRSPPAENGDGLADLIKTRQSHEDIAKSSA